ncbi:glycerophosphodiester phosphodiesterase [Alkalibacillus aidingensis]|uniref:glycerophosphodiester phosphodiesterase n=1 Tax=Alkalibacillus aidingensis TaxID=2747607 RepID=UPI002948C215|nr:glycerophosphodiester phosphodiesterase [Alkalibacillus aidingensis]
MFTIQTKIFAHRGACYYAPENTLPAFELAKQMGASGIELDVQMTKDQVPVVIHDENVKRTTNGTGLVKDYTYAELKQLDAGYWYDAKYKGTTIPSLADFLSWVRSTQLQINVELKTNVIEYPNIEQKVVELIDHYQLNNRTVLSSFNANSIRRLSEMDSPIELAWLTQLRVKNTDSLLKEIGANSIHIHTRILPSMMMKRIIQHHIPFRVYTVNKLKTMNKCLSLGAKAIITDVPDRAVKQFTTKNLEG